MTMKLLITGANGFVGTNLLQDLSGFEILCLGRVPVPGENFIHIDQAFIDGRPNTKLKDVDVVIHCAGLAHITDKSLYEKSKDMYFEVNQLYTRWVAELSRTLGVKKFIYMSTIKVNGEQTAGRPFAWNDEPNPKNYYSRSKFLGELEVEKCFSGTDTKYAIVRPPIIYGPGVKGNMASLVKLASLGLPYLYLDNFKAQRSMIATKNLNDFLKSLILSQTVLDRVFLVSDGTDLSFAELCKVLFKDRGRYIALPFGVLLRLLLTMKIFKNLHRALTEELLVDIAATTEQTGWVPRYTQEQCLLEMLKENKRKL